MRGPGGDDTEQPPNRTDARTDRDRQRLRAVVRYRVSDGEAVLTGVSPAFEEVFGAPAPDGEKRVATLLSDVDGGAAALETALDGGTGRVETDGRTFDVECLPDAVGRPGGRRDAGGDRAHDEQSDRDEQPATGALLFVDVTDYERRVTSLNEEVERLRTFTHALAHDLRNPLELAEVRVETARETGDLDHLEPVAEAHERIERLIDDVLDMARDGDELTDPEAVDLGSLVRETWDGVEHGDATLAVDGPLPTVEGSPRRLRRLFENLFRNAVEHAGPAPAIRVTRTEAGFAVCDDGPGIPPDEREDALSAGYTTRTEGTGLGLPIVARVAGAHGWSVEVETSDAGGARVHVVGAGRPAAGDR